MQAFEEKTHWFPLHRKYYSLLLSCVPFVNVLFSANFFEVPVFAGISWFQQNVRIFKLFYHINPHEGPTEIGLGVFVQDVVLMLLYLMKWRGITYLFSFILWRRERTKRHPPPTKPPPIWGVLSEKSQHAVDFSGFLVSRDTRWGVYRLAHWLRPWPAVETAHDDYIDLCHDSGKSKQALLSTHCSIGWQTESELSSVLA
jgi:hypothetical protein